MKQGQFSDTCPSRAGIFDGRPKSGVRELRLKCVMPIETERMIVAESVIGERVTFVTKTGLSCMPLLLEVSAICYWRSILEPVS